jgi:hypothetical protein
LSGARHAATRVDRWRPGRFRGHARAAQTPVAVEIFNQAYKLYGKEISAHMLDATAELSALIAALFEESRQKVMAFFDRKMSSSCRNDRKVSQLQSATLLR